MRSPQTAPDACASAVASTPARAGVHHAAPCPRSVPRSAAHVSAQGSAQTGLLPWLARLSPWLLIAGIGYAAVFIKPHVTGAALSQPVVERRDMFFGAAGDSASLWVVGQAGAVLHGQAGANRWSREAFPARTNLQAVAVSPDGVVVAAGNGGELWVKAPGGDWRKVSLPVAEVGNKLLDVQFIAGRFWVVGEMGALFRSSPEGSSWERLGQEQDVAFNAIRPGAEGDLWIAAEFGRLLRSRDGGMTWSTVELGSESLRSVAFNGRTGVAVGNTGHVYVSPDGGDSWNAIEPFTHEHLHDVAVTDGLWSVVGEHGLFFQSRNPAALWQDAAPAGLGKGYFTRVLPVAGGNLLVGRQLAMVDAGRLSAVPSGEQP